MAYQTGDTILEAHYNDFVTNGGTVPDNSATYTGIIDIIGTGTGDTGWGQSVTSLTTPIAGDSITALEWETFRAKLALAGTHTGQTLTSHSAITAGNTIAILAALETDLQTITDNRTTIAPALQQDHSTLTITSTRTSTWAGNAGPQVIDMEVDITFAGGNEARFFFNTGGEIRITPTLDIPASPNSKESDWQAFLANGIGTLKIAANASTRTASGETLTTDGLALGYYDLTAAFQTIIQINSDLAGDYTSNYCIIEAKTDGTDAVDGLGNTGKIITVKITYNDASLDEFENPPSQYTLDEIHNAASGYSATCTVLCEEAKILGEGGGVLTSDSWSTGSSIALGTAAGFD